MHKFLILLVFLISCASNRQQTISSIYYNLGNMYTKEKKYEEANKAYKEAIKLNKKATFS